MAWVFCEQAFSDSFSVLGIKTALGVRGDAGELTPISAVRLQSRTLDGAESLPKVMEQVQAG